MTFSSKYWIVYQTVKDIAIENNMLPEDLVHDLFVRTNTFDTESPIMLKQWAKRNAFRLLDRDKKKQISLIPFDSVLSDLSALEYDDQGLRSVDNRDETVYRLGKLNNHLKWLIFHKYYDGMTDKELSNLYNIPRQTITNQHNKALNIMRN